MFRGLFKFVAVNLECADTRICREHFIQNRQIVHHLLLGFVLGEPQFAPLVIVRVNESHNAAVAVNYNRFSHQREVIELDLDLLRIYVLPRRTQNHAFVAAAYVHIAVGIDGDTL